MLTSSPAATPQKPVTRSTHAPLTKSTSRLKRRKFASGVFAVVCFSATLIAFVMLVWLLSGIWRDGVSRLSPSFITNAPSRLFPDKAGIKPALLGSVWLIGITTLFAVPIGIGAAIYLQEYATANRWTRFAQVNIANLAAVPSVVYGILGLAVFVRALHLKTSLLAGGLTLALLILPVIIIASQEALRAVPSSLRDGSYALGATRWQTIKRQVFPVALPGIMTGIILSISRALGEAAPLIIIGGAGFVTFSPSGPMDDFTALPIQIYSWAQDSKEAFKELSATAIIVLVGVLLVMNGVAIVLRQKFNKN
ncbi:MAG TPA: phosphate ABC transporter permease PstA [Abditibacteriaceae bacterium]|jgi:phosphate transport system permease protein